MPYKTKICGIYFIRNIVTQTVYIGSSTSILERFAKHKSRLKLNKHENQYLQNSWNKYGKECFDFLIIEENIPKDKLVDAELSYINSIENKYNMHLYASSGPLGLSASDKDRRKSSEYGKTRVGELNSFYGKRHSEESKKMMSAIKTGKVMSDSFKMKNGIRSRGNSYGAKRYLVIFPEGTEIEIVDLGKFCRDMGWSKNTIYPKISKQLDHKGFKFFRLN